MCITSLINSLHYSVLRSINFQIRDSHGLGILDFKEIICSHNLPLCKIAARPTAYCFHKIKMLSHFILYAILSGLASAIKSSAFRFYRNLYGLVVNSQKKNFRNFRQLVAKAKNLAERKFLSTCYLVDKCQSVFCFT